jgi:signal transduction histidine kinase
MMRRLPGFAQSIRFRLTVLYSTLLFAVVGLLLAVTYVVVERSTDPHPITETYQAKQVRGEQVIGTMEVAEVEEVESAVNYRTLQTLRTFSVGALGGLFLLSLGIGWVLSGRALRPVRAIARTAEEIQATDLSRRIQLGGARDELRYLADTVDSMLDRLDAAFRAQRQLIDDASHELRSPLTIIRTNLDVALTAPDATEDDRRRAVAVLDRATTRMSHLVEDLLASARRSAPALADTDVDLAEVTRDALEDHGSLAGDRGLGLRDRLGTGLTLIGDPDALRRAVGNLLSNAVRLAPPGSDITVAGGHRDGWLWLAVADRGPGIAAAEQARVFDRFWRGPSGRDAGRRGAADRRTGLGLAIVRQIVESHGGQVVLFSTEGEGSTFVLWFPAHTAGAELGARPADNPMLGHGPAVSTGGPGRQIAPSSA